MPAEASATVPDGAAVLHPALNGALCSACGGKVKLAGFPECLRGPVAALCLLLAGCSDAPDAAPPSLDVPTIVSLNPCTDAILAEIAEPGQLLAISHYSHDPAATSMPMHQALAYPATGGTVEEVLAFNPDIVVASNFLPAATRSALSRMGMQVESFGPATSVEDSAAQIRRMGEIAGASEAGEDLAVRIELAWQDAVYGGAPVTALLWQQGGIVPGPESLVAKLMERSGFTSHSAARGLGQGAYLPLEEVLADPPQVLLAAAHDRMHDHPAIQHVDGISYDKFDPALFYCGGPSIIAALDRLAQLRRQALLAGEQR